MRRLFVTDNSVQPGSRACRPPKLFCRKEMEDCNEVNVSERNFA